MSTVVITGGSRGIGAAAVEAFAAQGHKVFFLYEKNHEAAASVASESAPSALGAVIRTDGGKLRVGLGHECLQLLFKQLVSGLGCSRLYRRTLGTGLGLALLGIETGITASTVIGAEIAITALSILTLGFCLQTLDGQIDLAVFIADDHDLHILTLGQMLTDVADIGIGNLRNMYHAGLVFRQGDECAEICDRLYLAL